jgi:dihydrofolate reductase
MRKLKIQVQMSIDGYIAGPKGEMEWMIWDWDEELKKYVYNITRTVDCIVMGRNLAEVFINTWQERLKDPGIQDSFARKMVATQKIVFTKTLAKNPWKNTKLAKGDLYEEILKLKKMQGRDIIAYGGVSFLTSLINTGLVDEFNLFINPVILGDGMSIFRNPGNKMNLEWVYSTSFECGITVLCYLPKKIREEETDARKNMSSANSPIKN